MYRGTGAENRGKNLLDKASGFLVAGQRHVGIVNLWLLPPEQLIRMKKKHRAYLGQPAEDFNLQPWKAIKPTPPTSAPSSPEQLEAQPAQSVQPKPKSFATPVTAGAAGGAGVGGGGGGGGGRRVRWGGPATRGQPQKHFGGWGRNL
eukprot:SAG11_NODE_13065_length_671_cov_6.073427_1_plen_146_part_01